ncbi:hypothetical protein HanPSC8_Chr08g0326321 [Helianthus annuus]|nr:hypothetical protein HanPSC8_Chr08g0326321 [Helianthus annuus]
MWRMINNKQGHPKGLKRQSEPQQPSRFNFYRTYLVDSDIFGYGYMFKQLSIFPTVHCLVLSETIPLIKILEFQLKEELLHVFYLDTLKAGSEPRKGYEKLINEESFILAFIQHFVLCFASFCLMVCLNKLR